MIAILAAMLLPALKNARARGQQASCINKCRQIMLAVDCYTADNGDWFPFDSSTNSERDGIWVQSLLPYINRTLPMNSKEVVGFYVDPGMGDLSTMDERWDSNYGGNNNLLKAKRCRKKAMVIDPGKSMFLLCGSYQNRIINVDKRHYWTYPHLKKSNVAFVDGHVDSYADSDIPTSSSDVWWCYSKGLK